MFLPSFLSYYTFKNEPQIPVFRDLIVHGEKGMNVFIK